MSHALDGLSRQLTEHPDKPILAVEFGTGRRIKSIRWVFRPELYTMKQIKEAFWNAFHQSGETFFRNAGDGRSEAEANESTAHHYADLEEQLTGTAHGVALCENPNCENPVVYTGEPYWPYCESCLEDEDIKRQAFESHPRFDNVKDMLTNTAEEVKTDAPDA